MRIMAEKEYKRKTFDEEWKDLKTMTSQEVLMRIFREMWDIRKAEESIARTMEAQNV